MSIRKLMLGVVFLTGVCAFGFRVGERNASAAANCKVVDCLEFYAEWGSAQGTYSYEKPGTVTPATGTGSYTAGSNYYTDTFPFGKLAKVRFDDENGVHQKVEQFSWLNASKACAAVNSKDVEPQYVNPADLLKYISPVFRYKCEKVIPQPGG